LQVDINGDNIKTVIETVKNMTLDPSILTSIDVIAIADVLVHIPNDTLINQTVSHSSHFILQIIDMIAGVLWKKSCINIFIICFRKIVL
jgi:hypothetical protein